MNYKLMVEIDGYEEEQEVDVECGFNYGDFEIEAIMFEGKDIQHKIPDILTNSIYRQCHAKAMSDSEAEREYWACVRAGVGDL